MKKIICVLFAIGIVTINSVGVAAMSTSKVRKNTRFLTDRMAYELNLSPEQYNDAYEINYDFINNVRYLMDDVVIGNTWALEDYYGLLDVRNDDLRWVLSRAQYTRFMGIEYFYRPIFASGGNWNFRVYIVYPNINFFYFAKPYHYRTYNGAHWRAHYNDRSYYHNRYHHDIYHGNHSFGGYNKYYRDDFKVTPRPGSSTRPSNRPSSRPGVSGTGSSRPSGSTTTTRPSTGSSSSRPGSSSRPSSTEGSTNRPSSSSRPSSTESSTNRPSATGRPATGSSTSRPSSSVRESGSSSSQSSRSNSSVNEKSSSGRSNTGTSSENRGNSGSSNSNRGGRR